MEALIFDCDGVIADTERDGHRVAFNEAFRLKGLAIDWDVETYGRLLQTAGGKERIKAYLEELGYPTNNNSIHLLIAELHQLKTRLFMDIIREGRLPLRSGVARLIDEAVARGIQLAVCSTSNEKAVVTIVETLLGQHRKASMEIFAGDRARRKKPDPEIYNLALNELNLNPRRCMVVEDSRNGLLAARAAGLNCIITKSYYTENEDFREADAIFPELGDGNHLRVNMDLLQKLIKE